MEKQLMEAHINSSGASKTEIANSFNESYDVIRQIAKKYNNLGTNGGSLVDQVTYVVTFVHPELKPLSRKMGETYSGYMNTPNSILAAQRNMPFPKRNVNTLKVTIPVPYSARWNSR